MNTWTGTKAELTEDWREQSAAFDYGDAFRDAVYAKIDAAPDGKTLRLTVEPSMADEKWVAQIEALPTPAPKPFGDPWTGSPLELLTGWTDWTAANHYPAEFVGRVYHALHAVRQDRMYRLDVRPGKRTWVFRLDRIPTPGM